MKTQLLTLNAFVSLKTSIAGTWNPVVVALITFVLLLIVRILNLASAPSKPKVFGRDEKFTALLKECAPELEQT